ncbi:MAG: hypothetical protein KTR25_12620 [Myxococcales bacterium]|nr:hypothetical protein [Myxococcales bacterium]
MQLHPTLDPDHVIAERELAFAPTTEAASTSAPNRSPVTIRFRLGRPIQHAAEWYCPFEVEGFGETRVEAAHGADSVQALLLALAKLRVVLSAMALEHHGHLAFAGGSGSGLPSLFEDMTDYDEAPLP